MKKIGVLLLGLSLLTLAITTIISKVAEAIFAINQNSIYTTPYLIYILIGIVAIGGVILIFTDNKIKWLFLISMFNLYYLKVDEYKKVLTNYGKGIICIKKELVNCFLLTF